jgi:hypothetical protein
MSSSRRDGTKLQNRVVAIVSLNSSENHSSNGLGEVIRARCYCDRDRLAVTKRRNKHGDGINPLLM